MNQLRKISLVKQGILDRPGKSWYPEYHWETSYTSLRDGPLEKWWGGGGGGGEKPKKNHARENATKKKNSCREEGKEKKIKLKFIIINIIK